MGPATDAASQRYLNHGHTRRTWGEQSPIRTREGGFVRAGVGIHTGLESSVHIYPGHSGIAWHFEGRRLSRPRYEGGMNTTTAVFECGLHIQCVEHLMAAIALSAVSDIDIDVQGEPELPFLDGSAWEYFSGFQTGPDFQSGPTAGKSISRITLLTASSSGSWLLAAPSANPSVSAFTEFGEPLGAGVVSTSDLAPSDLACARSFIRDPIDAIGVTDASIRLRGLQHALANDALILWSTSGLQSSLRYPHEWRYHKLLDLIGDLRCEAPIAAANIFAYRPGHSANHEFRDAIANLKEE
jgi:UDP-3-O-acyl-N-acetylglucosamine deacetylase